MIALDMNENRCIKPLNICLDDISYNDYPRRLSGVLKGKIASKFNIPKESIILTNGIDEGISIFLNYVLNNKWTVLVDVPNYVGVFDTIDVLGVQAVYNKQEISYDYDKTIECLQRNPYIKAVYIANPRNPIGDFLENIERLIMYCVEKKIILFLDEAYIEFCSVKSVSLDYIFSFDNVIVARTFSKAYGLAAIRCGYLIVCGDRLRYEFGKLWETQPYHISQHSLVCASLALDDDERLLESVKKIDEHKKRLYSLLEECSVPYLETQTNFVLFKNVNGIDKHLRENEISVTETGPFGARGYLRITIGNDSEMEYFFHIIKKFFGGYNETI